MNTALHIQLSSLPRTSIPETYRELANLYLPRPIHNQENYEAALEVVNMLIGFNNLNPDQAEYLDVVSGYVEQHEREELAADWERIHSQSTPETMVAFFMGEHSLTQTVLSKKMGISQTALSRFLNGQRRLTAKEVGRLAHIFSAPPSLFVPKTK